MEKGEEIPFRAENLLQTAGIVIDEGPLTDLVLQPDNSQKVAEAAVSIIGPKTIAQLIEQLLAIHQQLRALAEHADAAMREEYYRLVDRIAKTNLGAFVEAILTRADTCEPREIAQLADLMSRHGDMDNRGPLPIHEPLYTCMVDTIKRWMEIVI